MYCHPESILAVRSSLSLWGFHGKFAPHLLSCTVPKNMLLTMSHTQINRCWELYRLSRVPFRLWHFPWNLQNATLYNFRESFVEIHKQVIVLLILCMRRIEEFSATVISHVKYFPPSFKSFSGHAVKWHSALKFHNSFQLKGKKKLPSTTISATDSLWATEKLMKEIVITSILSWSLQDLRAFPRLWLIPSIKEKGRRFAGR